MQQLKYTKQAIVLLAMLLCRLSGYAQQEVYICPGDTLHLQARAAYAAHYIWYRDNVRIGSEANASLAVTEPGNYAVLATGDGDCVSELSWPVVIRRRLIEANYDTVYTVMNAPVEIDALGNDESGCWELDGRSLHIERPPMLGAAVAGKNGRVTYSPHAAYSGVDSFVYTVKDMSGQVSNRATVSIWVSAGCAMAYPNPGRDVVHVQLLLKDVAHLRLVDASGQILQKLPALYPAQTIDISPYAEGLYVLQLLNAEGNVLCLYKLVKRL